jgi:hypothetical protein
VTGPAREILVVHPTSAPVDVERHASTDATPPSTLMSAPVV